MHINIYKIKTLLKYLFEMEKSTITLTRRIQMLIDLPANEQKEMWEKLYRYQNRCFRAANFIVSHLYVQEMIKDFFYLTEEIQYKLADASKDETGIFTRQRIILHPSPASILVKTSSWLSGLIQIIKVNSGSQLRIHFVIPSCSHQAKCN